MSIQIDWEGLCPVVARWQASTWWAWSEINGLLSGEGTECLEDQSSYAHYGLQGETVVYIRQVSSRNELKK